MKKDEKLKLAFTGHTNIEKAKGYPFTNGSNYNFEAFHSVYFDIENFIKENLKSTPLKNLTVISGAARGVDEVAALFAIQNGLELILCVPHSVAWHKSRGPSRGYRAQAVFYDYILNYKKLTIHEVKKEQYNYKYVNFSRNHHMVDISDKVVSYKCYESSGTDHCIGVAKKARKYIGNIPDYIRKENV